jgi:hypothetical protein
VLDRSLEEMRVTLLTTVARRVGAPGDVFEPIDVFAALPEGAKLLRPHLDVRVELVRIIERRHHNVSTLPPIRVVAVVRNDIAGNGVVIWIHHGHAGSIRLPGISGSGVRNPDGARQNGCNVCGPCRPRKSCPTSGCWE